MYRQERAPRYLAIARSGNKQHRKLFLQKERDNDNARCPFLGVGYFMDVEAIYF